MKFFKSLINWKGLYPDPAPDLGGRLISDPPDPGPQHCFQV
jgi:hypothetical protein